MRCGHCKQEGVDVEHVRNCAGATVIVDERPLVADGYYTVVFDEARDDRITLRVRAHWDAAAAKRGDRVVDYLMGADNIRDYQGFAFLTSQGELRVWKRFAHNARLRDAWDIVVKDPDETGMAYALHSGNCRRCGRTLTVPASIHRGLGPVCAGVG